MSSFLGILGLFTLLAIAYLLSENKNAINYKTVVYGLIFQLFFHQDDLIISQMQPIEVLFFHYRSILKY